MKIPLLSDEPFELVGVDIVTETLQRFMDSPDSDQYLDELYYICERDPNFRDFLLETFGKAIAGDLSELDLSGFKFKVKEAFSNRYASQELTFLIVFVISISLISYTLTPIPDAEHLSGSRIMISALFAEGLATFIALYRSGTIERRVDISSDEISKAMNMYNRVRANHVNMLEDEF